MKVSVGVSNRHIHLNKEVLEILFGEGYELKELKRLTQLEQFASTDVVTIKGNKGSIENVRVLGPLRDYTQVEVSVSDSYKLGVVPPVRNSGVLENSETLTIIGPQGEVTLDNCCIIANRHIHMNNTDAVNLGLENYEYVKVQFETARGAILDDVYLKVSDSDVFEMHIDTDEANALGLKNGDVGIIRKR